MPRQLTNPAPEVARQCQICDKIRKCVYVPVSSTRGIWRCIDCCTQFGKEAERRDRSKQGK